MNEATISQRNGQGRPGLEHVTLEVLIEAARTLTGQGEAVTVPKLRNLLGRGSYATYYRHLPDVLKALEKDQVMPLPPEVVRAFQGGYLEFLDYLGELEAEAARTLDADRQSFEEECAAARAEQAKLISEHGKACAEAERLKTDNEALRADNRALAEQAAQATERARGDEARLSEQARAHSEALTLLEGQLEKVEAARQAGQAKWLAKHEALTNEIQALTIALDEAKAGAQAHDRDLSRALSTIGDLNAECDGARANLTEALRALSQGRGEAPTRKRARGGKRKGRATRTVVRRGDR